MRARLLAGIAVAAGVVAAALAVACSNDSLPQGEFPLDAAALDLRSCFEGSAPVVIASLDCPAAACPGSVAYAICTGTDYGACSCKGPKVEDDGSTTPMPFPTGSGDASIPDVGADDDGGDEGGSEAGPSDGGVKDVGVKDAGPADTGAKDTGKPTDSGAKG